MELEYYDENKKEYRLRHSEYVKLSTGKQKQTAIISCAAKKYGAEYHLLSDKWTAYLIQPSTQIKLPHFRSLTHLPFNSNVAAELCNDKASTVQILSFFDIPHVPAVFISSPTTNAPEISKWKQIIDFFEANGKDIVLKNPHGSNGANIFRAKTYNELEKNCEFLFEQAKGVLLSPFVKIEYEYRNIVLNGEVLLVYRKTLPFVLGDGVKTIYQLIIDRIDMIDRCNDEINENNNNNNNNNYNNNNNNNNYKENNEMNSKQKMANDRKIMDYEIIRKGEGERVAEAGEKISLNWKHNLSQGSLSHILYSIDYPDPSDLDLNDLDLQNKLEIMKKISEDTVKALGVRFASVDIVEDEKGELKVLEVNNGVFLAQFSVFEGQRGLDISLALYHRSLSLLFPPLSS